MADRVMPAGQAVVLLAWGVFAPFIWFLTATALSARIGLRPIRARLLVAAVASLGLAVVAAVVTRGADAMPPMFGLVVAAVFSCAGLRIFEPASAPRVRPSSPEDPRLALFARIAYGWLIAAAALSVWAARADAAVGLWAAARHAFTVGFMSTTVLAIGHRMLPAFANRKQWSPRLMAFGLTCLAAGCLVRVCAEILVRDWHQAWAWPALSASAIVELTGFAASALDVVMTMIW